MSRLDVDLRAVLWSALTIAAIVAGAIGLGFTLLHAWHEPPGGAPSGAASLLPALHALGPTLQSAPQLDRAAERVSDRTAERVADRTAGHVAGTASQAAR